MEPAEEAWVSPPGAGWSRGVSVRDVRAVCRLSGRPQPQVLRGGTRTSPRAALEMHLPGTRGEAPEMALDEPSTLSASNVKERGAVRARFLRETRGALRVGGAAAKQGPAAWLPAAGRTGADPRVLPCPEGTRQGACGF